MLIAGTAFASSSLEEKGDKLVNVETELVISNEHVDDYGCRVSCYATATNMDTGAVHYFEAESTSSDCATATMNCYHKAMGKAMNFIKAYDGQQ